VERSSYRYEPRPDRNIELREELVKLAQQKPRYGYRRLHVLLQRRGHEVNVKRIYRLYVEEGLAVRRRKRKRLVRDRALEPRLIRPNQEWAMDFIIDGLATGRMVRILSVVDAYTRECLALEADTSLGSGRVTRVLERLIGERGRPENLRSDNVLTQERKAEEKRSSLSIPHGMCLTTTVPPSGFHEQGLSVRP
jgi:putative transposase